MPEAKRIAFYWSVRTGGRISWLDLQSAAWERLCIAATRYVPGRGSPERWASVWIRRGVFERMAAGAGVVTRPRKAVERARRVAREAERLTQARLAQVSVQELAEELSEEPETLDRLDALLNRRWVSCGPGGILAVESLEEPAMPPVTHLLGRFIVGWTVPEIAADSGLSRTTVRARITDELRQFFRT